MNTVFRVKIIALFILQLAIWMQSNAQSELRNAVHKLMRYELGINQEEVEEFYVGVYTDSTWTEELIGRPEQLNNKIDTIEKFEIGSVSKLFTALNIYLFQEDSALTLSDTLGLFFEGISKNTASISIADLLRHSSGLPQVIDYSILADVSNEKSMNNSELIRFLIESNIDSLKKPSYSHLNYATLGAIINSLNNSRSKKPVFHYSEGMQKSISELKLMCEAVTSLPLSHQLYREHKLLSNIPETLSGHGLFIKYAGRDKKIYFHSGRTVDSRIFVGFLPQINRSVLIVSPYDEPLWLDLGIELLRTISNNWKNL